MISAMTPAQRKKKNEVIRYMCSMILGSVEDSQSARIDPLRSVLGVSYPTTADCSIVLTECSRMNFVLPAGQPCTPGIAAVSRPSVKTTGGGVTAPPAHGGPR